MGHTGAKTELLSKAQHKPANNYLLSPPHRCCALVFSDPFLNFFALRATSTHFSDTDVQSLQIGFIFKLVICLHALAFIQMGLLMVP